MCSEYALSFVPSTKTLNGAWFPAAHEPSPRPLNTRLALSGWGLKDTGMG